MLRDLNDTARRDATAAVGVAPAHAVLDVERLDGRTIVITGATGGIGFFVAEQLARLGAEVVVAGRSEQKMQAVLAALPGSGHRTLRVDLGDVESIRDAGGMLGERDRLDGFVMNAGIVAPAGTRSAGPFGLETTVAVNHLAHAELLRLAMPALERAPRARVVSTGSIVTRRHPFERERFSSGAGYRPRLSYATSKHVAEMFGFELDRRLRLRGSTVQSVVTHPGEAIDVLTPDRPGIHHRTLAVRAAAALLGPFVRRRVAGKDTAAASAVRAVAARSLPAGAYLGPEHGAAGRPALVEPVATSRDPLLGAWIWQETERLLGRPVLPPG